MSGQKIIEGLQQALAHVRGEVRAKVHTRYTGTDPAIEPMPLPPDHLFKALPAKSALEYAIDMIEELERHPEGFLLKWEDNGEEIKTLGFEIEARDIVEKHLVPLVASAEMGLRAATQWKARAERLRTLLDDLADGFDTGTSVNHAPIHPHEVAERIRAITRRRMRDVP